MEKRGKKMIYIDFEEGSSFYEPFLKRNFNLCEFEKDAFKIFSICPLTCDYINKRFNTNKRVSIPFFYSEDNIIQNIEYSNKKNDIIYSGNINELSKKLKEYFPLYDIYDVIKTYKTHIWIGGIANNYNAPSYLDKIKAYSISKIAVIHNVLCQQPDKGFLDTFKDTEYYKYTEKTKLVPQIKSRLFEGAFNKCILLCYNDDYKSIECLFKENEDFLYWKTKEELKLLIDQILLNYDNYTYLAENAYKKAINNYTTEKFVHNILIPNLK